MGSKKRAELHNGRKDNGGDHTRGKGVRETGVSLCRKTAGAPWGWATRNREVSGEERSDDANGGAQEIRLKESEESSSVAETVVSGIEAKDGSEGK